jgi:diamine N-acetyltransferase
MLYDDPEKPQYFLWRFMIDARYQGRGYGRQAMACLLDYVRTRPGAAELLLSCVPGEGSPDGFYRQPGFELTGNMHGDEQEMKLGLT